MKTQPLSKTNPHLKDVRKRNALIRKQIIDSSAVEGIDAKRLNKILPKNPNHPH